MPVLVVLLVIPILGLYAFIVSGDRWQSTREEVHREVANLAAGLEKQAELAYTAIDIELQTIAEVIRLQPSLLDDSAAMHSLLERVRGLLPAVSSLQLTDNKGVIRHSSGLIPAAPLNVGDRDYFRGARDTGAHFGKPIVGAISNTQTIPIAHRLQIEGRFAGVVLATVMPRQLARLLGEVSIGPHGALTLLTADGTVLVRSPERNDVIGKDISETAFFRMLSKSKSAAGVVAGNGEIDGIRRLNGYRALSAYPLIVLAATEESRVAATAWREVLPVLLTTGLLGAFICGLTILLALAGRRSVRSHQRLIDAINSLPDAFAFFDREGQLVQANPAFRSFLPMELTPQKTKFEELIPAFTDLVSLPDMLGSTKEEWAARRLGNFREPGPPFTVKLRNDRWIRVVDQRLSDGSMVTMGVDVTQPKQAQEAQERMSRQQQLVSRLSQVALTALDATVLSERAAALVSEGLGVEMAGVLERDREARGLIVRGTAGTRDIGLGHRVQPLEDGLSAFALNSDVPTVFQDAASDPRFRLHPILAKAGIRAGIAVKIPGHRAPLGLLVGFTQEPRVFDQDEVAFLQSMAFVLSNAAERRLAEAMLSQAQRLESLGQLTGGIAHDFNNLLTVIAGQAEVLKDELPKDSEHQEWAASVWSAAKRAAELTHQLLAFARGQMLESTEFDVNEMIAEAMPLLRRTLEENIELKLLPGKNLPRCRTDRSQLLSALMNLAINARDAMPSGGRLTIECGLTHLDQFYADGYHDVDPGHYIEINVSDNGTGMNREVIDHAFEPFFTTKPPGKGTGLGLSMVYGFMKQTGGHVRIYSEVGVGTSIKLYVPLANAASTGAPESATEDVPRGRGERILVVEDEAAVRSFAGAQLRRLGYAVIEAANGREAVELVSGGVEVDLVFSDMVMPGGLNGLQTAHEIASLRPKIRVLFTSGYAAGTIQDSLEEDLGGFKLLNKPYSVQQLARKIRDSLEADMIAT